MDEGIGVGAGPSERARHAGGDGPAPALRRRMSAGRKRDAVLRLLRGEDLELVSREFGVTAAELSGWRGGFLAGGGGLRGRRSPRGRGAGIGRPQGEGGGLSKAPRRPGAQNRR